MNRHPIIFCTQFWAEPTMASGTHDLVDITVYER
jgi:hypothetical protein